MSRKTKYADKDIGEPRVIDDFLPPPDQLVLKEDTVKVTIALSRSSVEFFKQEARRHHTRYQKMIRNLLDAYCEAHRSDKRKTR